MYLNRDLCLPYKSKKIFFSFGLRWHMIFVNIESSFDTARLGHVHSQKASNNLEITFLQGYWCNIKVNVSLFFFLSQALKDKKRAIISLRFDPLLMYLHHFVCFTIYLSRSYCHHLGMMILHSLSFSFHLHIHSVCFVLSWHNITCIPALSLHFHPLVLWRCCYCLDVYTKEGSSFRFF